MPEMKAGYVIYDPVTKLYSSGGMHNSWSKVPKIWGNIGSFKNHLNLFMAYKGEVDWSIGPAYNSRYKGHEHIFEIVSKKFISTVGEYVKELSAIKVAKYNKERSKYNDN